MKPLPAWPPLVTFAIVSIGVVLSTVIERATLRGWYVTWTENQTFVAAMIALGAALYAARPVFEQLSHLSLQSAIASKEILSDRLINARKLAGQLSQHNVTLSMAYPTYDEEDEPDGIDVPRWVESLERPVAELNQFLGNVFANRLLPTEITSAASSALKGLSPLSDCIDDMLRPDMMRGDPEYFDAEHAELEAKAHRAFAELGGRTKIATDSIASLRSVFAREIRQLTAAIRKIDATILEHHISG